PATRSGVVAPLSPSARARAARGCRSLWRERRGEGALSSRAQMGLRHHLVMSRRSIVVDHHPLDLFWNHRKVRICSPQRYLLAPRLTTAATSATRLPRARASATSFSSMPGESGPVVALAPNPPPPLTTIIWLMSMAPRMVSIVTSFPLETAPPVANAPPTLLRILRSCHRPNLRSQLSRKVFTQPDMFPKYTGDPTTTASEDTRSSPVTSPTRFRTTLVPGTALAPSAAPWAIFSVLPVAEW